MDTEGVLEIVRFKRVEFKENVRAFFPLEQSKLSVIMRCPGFDCTSVCTNQALVVMYTKSNRRAVEFQYYCVGTLM